MASVLIVDDSDLARYVLSGRLVAEGFDVMEAGSASEAKERIAPHVFCTILDVELPDGDAPSLAAELRRSVPSLAIAFFTSGGPADRLARLQSYGPVFSKQEVDAVVAWVHGVSSRGAQPPPTK